MAKSRKCKCCATKYSYCPSCSGADRLKPTWYAQFCSEECMTLWTTAVKFNMKMIDQAEAKMAIKSLDLKDKSEYAESIQRDMDIILKENVVEVETPSVDEPTEQPEIIVQEEPVVIEEVVIQEDEQAEDVPVQEEKPSYYKKSKRNKAKSHEVVEIEEDK